MNKKLSLKSLALALSVLITGCSSDEISPFTEGGGISSTNIVSAGNFSMGFSSSPAVLTLANPPVAPAIRSVAPCTDLTVIDGSQTTTITVTGADNQNAAVSGVVVYFQVEWGTLNPSTCTLNSGSCSVEWSANTNIDRLTTANNTDNCLFNGIGDVSLFNSVTAWALGEEFFLDNDGDVRLSDAESFIDTDEPYLDRNDNGTYDATTDNLTSADTNGQYDGPDGVFNGPSCDTSTRTDCGTGQLTPIYDKTYMVIGL